MDRDQTFGHGHLGPVTDAPEVMRVAKRHNAGAMALRSLDRHLHRVAADHLAVALAAIERKQRAGVERRRRMLIRREAALEHRVDVTRDHADAVRIVAEEIRHDQVLGD